MDGHTQPPPPMPHLTGMEMKVMLLLCRDDCLLEKEMPEELGISMSTFKTHREHLYAKCKVHSREELIVKAIRWHLVPCYCGHAQLS